ncbi:MAG TPA: PAS domain S-box protein [Candidatus Acidoferrales bacterium]|nr:PAS domain S-box protein [Candidatus Acidoferrales bacterium]
MSSTTNNVPELGKRRRLALRSAPVFAEDDKTREARLLHIVAWSYLVIVAGAMVLLAVLLPKMVLRWSLIFAVALISALSALLLNRRGRTRPASFLLLAALWLAVSGDALTSGGIRAPTMTAYLCVILAAGLLLGERAGIVVGLVSALSGLAFVLLEAHGWLPVSRVHHTLVSLWCVLVTFIAVVIVLQRLAVRSVKGALEQARSLLQERKEAEEAIRKSEEKFSKAFRASPDGLAISELETGRYIEVNEGYCRLYGHTREQMLGHTSLELGILDNPADREIMVRGLKTAGVVRDLELRTRTRSGELRIISLSAESIEIGGTPCLVSVLHDITDRIRAEQALRESEQRFRSYFDLAAVGFSITGRDRRLLAVNDDYCRILGYSREELLQKTWAELTHPEDLVENEEKFNLVLAGKTDAYTLDKRLFRKDGQIVHGTVSARCVRGPDGSPDYFVSLLLDITDRHRAALREKQARQEFTQQLIASQEAERQRIAAELHDSLGQNLSVIKNRAQLALQLPGLPVDAARQLEAIERVVAETIADTRNLAHNLRPLHVEQVGLTDSLGVLIREISQSSDIHFERRLENVDDLFTGNAATNVYRIVQEALNNLIKHSQAREAAVTLERDVRSVRLRVADDGVGFDTGATRKRGGLGLNNIRERVSMLGGTVTLHSAPGQGTQLTIELPIADGAGEPVVEKG